MRVVMRVLSVGGREDRESCKWGREPWESRVRERRRVDHESREWRREGWWAMRFIELLNGYLSTLLLYFSYLLNYVIFVCSLVASVICVLYQHLNCFLYTSFLQVRQTLGNILYTLEPRHVFLPHHKNGPPSVSGCWQSPTHTPRKEFSTLQLQSSFLFSISFAGSFKNMLYMFIATHWKK